ncbi:MAG: NAD(P)-binding domain-containing protein, partial [Clostridia bacterium]|nr:NAD(P)-binding domain-containing protein [Clostridia bacterium]
MIRLGILGFGNMGTGHAKNIIAGKCPEIEIAAVCDLKQERLDAAKEMLGDGVTYFTDAIK